MPIDGHAYLSKQGWAGKGSGLRDGAISRPLSTTQKKTLSGLGKDRDEAFPFWDHVFAAAAQTITIRIRGDDDDDDHGDTDPSSLPTATIVKRTTTGIISNRRPVAGVAAYSGDTTPDNTSEQPMRTLLSLAKQQAAKSALYSKFFRGPVLSMKEDTPSPSTLPAPVVPPSETDHNSNNEDTKKTKKRKRRLEESIPEDVARSKKKRRSKLISAPTIEFAQARPEAQVASHALDTPTALSASVESTKRKKRKERPLLASHPGGDQQTDPGMEEQPRKRKPKSTDPALKLGDSGQWGWSAG